MTDEGSKPRGRIGCALLVLVAIGAVLGIGLWIGQRKDAERTPCERYMHTILEAGDHCHSGVTRKAEYHVGICERIDRADRGLLRRHPRDDLPGDRRRPDRRLAPRLPQAALNRQTRQGAASAARVRVQSAVVCPTDQMP